MKPAARYIANARRLIDSVADLGARLVEPFKPTPDTTEGAVMLGLVLLAAAFLSRGMVDFALGVPGIVLVLIGAAPVIAALRKGGA